MLKVISWNIRRKAELWRDVTLLNADVALLQEAVEPPADLLKDIDVEAEPWCTPGLKQRRWRTSLVGLRSGLRVDRITARSLAEADSTDLAVSRIGTLSAANVIDPNTAESVTLISMYSLWEQRHPSGKGDRLFADASAHRLISDISGLVAQEKRHRIIAAGDLNCLYGHGERGRTYWAARYQTVFDRFAAIGLRFVGPQFPSGRQATPWPSELPAESKNVPTYYTSRQTPSSAQRQLDFVFASKDFVSRVDVRALNGLDEWGRSDHCRVEITVRDA